MDGQILFELCTVQVKLELGHRAQLRKKVTSEGFTHDWMVFVRGPETGDIQHFVEKVVFRLHESFPKPKRVCKEPPYKVEESGYAGFLMPIEVYFKNKSLHNTNTTCTRPAYKQHVTKLQQ
uniref:MLLT1 super elongation complex subunit n=1 Tax=Oreochromis niloticus TaxID=8128 RepID=A0A669D5L6_ORENI